LTTSIVKRYIEGRNTIILAVSGANDDLGNSISLKVAKEVDNSLERTLGIMTKIDLMDAGTDCIDIIKNSVICLS
jgi:replication fork clamp-binding protein CrfC